MDVTVITDILSRKNVNEYYSLYQKTQWYDKEAMRQFQLLKLRKLIDHCYSNVPYYREYMDSCKIKVDDISSIADIRLFPVLTKEIIKDNYEKFIPLNLKYIKGVKVSQTGGTTGNILFKRNDANTRSSIWATYKRFRNDWMGVKDRDRSLLLMGGHVLKHSFKDEVKKRIVEILSNAISFNPYDTSEINYLHIRERLKKDDFVLLKSYSQFLYSLAVRLKSENLSFNIKAITTTAEPLTQEHRDLFEEVFHAEVYDQYGCGEIGGIAYECPCHEGLHISEERVIAEINDKSELILTDLDNYAMPFIRYWNADEVIVSSKPCSCGRKSLLLKKIQGRTCDYIIGVNGEILHWAYFWHLFFDSMIAEKRNLIKFQVVQTDTSEILLRIVANEFTEEEKLMLISDIHQRLGNISVKFSFEKDIENSASGKYRPVVNKLLIK